MQNNKKADLLLLYDIIAGVMLIFSAISLLTNHAYLGYFLDTPVERLFSDFINHINHTAVLKDVYDSTIHACFPPLIYLFYHSLYLIIPNDYQGDGYYYLLYAIYLAVVFVLLSVVIKDVLKSKNTTVVNIAIILIVLSNSFTYGVIERANIVILSAVLLLLASVWKESPNKIKREAALVFIALAAAIKVYPALFGLVYLFEKRFKESVRLIIYGILFFFVPFIFTGGFNGVVQFFKNQMAVHYGWGESSKISIYSFLCSFDVSKNISFVVAIALAVFAIVLAYFVKTNWKRYYLLCFVMVACPLWSGRYTICIMLVPFISFILENKSINVYSIIYLLLFSIMFSADFNVFIPLFKYVIILLFICFVITFDELFKYIENKKRIKE